MQKHLTLQNDVQQLSLLADYIDAIATEGALDPALAMSLNLALEEAVANVVLYAYPEGTDGTVDIDATMADGLLTFVIADSGVPFDPTTKAEADVTLSLEERPIGGLGIFLVRQLMDTVAYERKDNRNILTLTKHLTPHDQNN